MKKLIAVLLAALMSLALFAVSASAADSERVVGVADGDTPDEFTEDKSGEKPINVQVSQVTHKYAVDLTFDFSDLTIGGIVWDVTELKYKTTSTLADSTQKITVSNRSDLPVDVQSSVVEPTYDDCVTVTSTHTTKTKVDQSSIGAATNMDITVNIKPSTDKTWDDVVNYYAQKMINDGNTPANGIYSNYVLATITVTISKSAS